MAISNGTSTGVDIKKKDEIDLGESSTEGDIFEGGGAAFAGAGMGGVFPLYFYNGWGGIGGNNNQLLPELPAYWSKSRDAVLINTIKREPFWNGAVKKAIAKGVTQKWDLKFNERNRGNAEKYREMFRTSNGRRGFKNFLIQHLQDYFLTDNGAFIEIDREDNSKPGSRIIGLYHLDSMRCYRTGDPNLPVVYSDLHNQYHFMAWWQVWDIADTPNARNNYFGVGDCAAAGAYERIRRMVAIRLLQYQMMTAGTPHALTALGGVTPQQLADWKKANDADRLSRGLTVFGGHMMAAIMAKEPVSSVTIPLMELPKNYNEPDEIEQAAVEYSAVLGIPKTDLKALTGRMAGTATQAEVLDAQNDSGGLALWSGAFEDFINEMVTPSTITYFWNFDKAKARKIEADIANAYVTAATGMVTGQMLVPQKANNWLVDKDVLPKEYLMEGDVTDVGMLSEDDKPDVVSAEIGQQPSQGQMAQSQPQQPTQAQQAAQQTGGAVNAQVQDVLNQIGAA